MFEGSLPTRASRAPRRAAGASFALGVCAALTIASLLIPSPSRAQTVDPNLWVPNGPVNAAAILADTVFIGGSFTRVQPVTGGGAPFDLTTAFAATGLPRVHGRVYSAISDGANGWFIGGSFDSVGVQPHRNVAHILANLSVDPWSPTVDEAVYSLALSGTTLYIGGVFQNVNATKKPWLAALNTTTGALTGWSPELDGPVFAMGITGTTVYVGGQFFTINGSLRSYLGAIDQALGTPTSWDPEPDNFVWALAFGTGVVYAGGDFATVASGATARSGAAAWSTSTGALTSWDPDVSGTVLSLAVSGTTIYLGGSFNQLGANTMRNNLAAVNNTTGNTTTWNPNANDAVLAIAVSGTNVLVGGDFTTVGGQPRSRLASIAASNAAIQAWAPEPDDEVDCLVLGGTNVYAGGLFNSGGGIVRTNLAALDLTTGLPTIWNPNANQPVDALVVGTDKISYFLYAGGRFTTVGGVARPYLAKIGQGPGAVITTFNAACDSAVTTLAFWDYILRAGGRFKHIGGATRSNAAALTNGGVATSWAPVLNGIVYAIAPGPSGSVFLGGAFTTPRLRVGKFDADGGVLSWNANADGTVYSLAPQGNILFLGGDFHVVGDSTRLRIAATDTTAGIPLAWNPSADSTVRVMDASAGMFMGGSFITTGGFTRKGAASYDSPESNSNGKLNPWNPVVIGSVSTIVPYGNRTVIGGNFSNVKTIPRAFLALVGAGSRPASVALDRPGSIDLGPVWPNPLRGEGRIRFTLPRASRVSLALYDIAGRRARAVLDDRMFPAGAHVATLPTSGLEPGIYFAHVRAGAALATRKLVIIH